VGRLVRAEIDEPSGLGSLDGEAKRALEKAQPLAAPPPGLLDDFGELGLRLDFHLDLSVSAFLAGVRREIAEQWHPALAFQRFARPEQVAVVRVLVSPAGAIAQATLESPSGIGHLDDTALAAAKPGTRVPNPPRALSPAGESVSLRLVFVPDVTGHGTVRVERDRAAAR
jgi:TonB family protein